MKYLKPILEFFDDEEKKKFKISKKELAELSDIDPLVYDIRETAAKQIRMSVNHFLNYEIKTDNSNDKKIHITKDYHYNTNNEDYVAMVDIDILIAKKKFLNQEEALEDHLYYIAMDLRSFFISDGIGDVELKDQTLLDEFKLETKVFNGMVELIKYLNEFLVPAIDKFLQKYSDTLGDDYKLPSKKTHITNN
jgi:hypothetical protein